LLTSDHIGIKNFLTLRYNPNEKPPLSRINENFFTNSNFDENGLITEKLLKKNISNSLKKYEEPFVISLSSGIDSSLTLGLIRNIFPKKEIIAICGVFNSLQNEAKQAKKIANEFNAEFIELQMDSIFKNMPKIISITSKPRWNTYTHLIANEAKKFGRILITGDGADEVFGGYTFRYSKFLKLTKPNQSALSKTKNYLECHNRDWVPDQNSLFHKNMKFNWDDIYEHLKPNFSNNLDLLNQVISADFNGKLIYDFIPTGNSIAEHYNLVRFSPFLKSEVIKFGLGLTSSQKFNEKSQIGKLTLRQISQRMNIPHINDKRGFSPDLWLDWNNFGKKISLEFLLDETSQIYKQKIINYNWIENNLEKITHDGDMRYLSRFISIFALEVWLKIFSTNEISKETIL